MAKRISGLSIFFFQNSEFWEIKCSSIVDWCAPIKTQGSQADRYYHGHEQTIPGVRVFVHGFEKVHWWPETSEQPNWSWIVKKLYVSNVTGKHKNKISSAGRV